MKCPLGPLGPLCLLILAVLSGFGYADDMTPYFYADDPVWMDNDSLNIAKPDSSEISQYFDFLENTFYDPGTSKNIRAQNINTLGEVPDSSWFNNRHGIRRLSMQELLAGPRTHPGPDMTAPWYVTKGKSEGVTPGFRIKDKLGQTYFVKFDPLDHPEMTTSAEIICTLFFHAIGYNVPSNYLVDIDPANIMVSGTAEMKGPFGQYRQMTDNDLKTILVKAPRRSDGKIRVIASKAINGKPLGPFRYYGTRNDDGNDIVDHEHRRELRGLRVFAAWLNHDDSRSVNTLDMYTQENQNSFVKHYLIDFGSCLGSGSVKPQTYRAGNEYMWDLVPTVKTMASMGLWVRPYLKIRYPDYPSLGRIESQAFRPELWKPEYPNPAFERMDTADAFWAAKIVMRFTDEDIRHIVSAGKFSDKNAEKYLSDTLIKRRDKIGAYYLTRINPVDNFRIEDDRLFFENPAVRYGFGDSPSGYNISCRLYDNTNGKSVRTLAAPVTIKGTSYQLPSILFTLQVDAYCFVEIIPANDTPLEWQKPVRVYLRTTVTGPEIVGIIR